MLILVWYLLVFLLLIQAYFLFGFFFPLSKSIRKPNRLPLPVSVIICAKNELDNLKSNLSFILKQHHPVFEVIILDDHSEDGTDKYVKSLLKKHNNLFYFKASDKIKDKLGKKWALSEAIQKAQYEHLLLTDADCRPSSLTWIQEMTAMFTGKTSIVLGIGQYNFAKKWYDPLIQYETFFTAISYLGFAKKGHPYMGLGRNMSYRKNLFDESLMKKHEIASGDDDLFIQEVANSDNTVICLSKKAQTFSESPGNYREWLKQKQRHYSTGLKYNFSNKVRLAALKASFYLPNFCFLLLFFEDFHLYLLFFVFILRWLVVVIVFNLLILRLGFLQRIYFLPWFELYFTFFDLWTAIKNAIKKPVWK